MERVVIIGGGPGGYESALVASQLGADVTVVDSSGLGGSAVLTDCVPSKTLIATSELMADLADAPELGVNFQGADGDEATRSSVDLTRVNRRVKQLAADQSADIGRHLERDEVKVLVGRAGSTARAGCRSSSPTEASRRSRPTRSCSRPVRRPARWTARGPTVSGS